MTLKSPKFAPTNIPPYSVKFVVEFLVTANTFATCLLSPDPVTPVAVIWKSTDEMLADVP